MKGKECLPVFVVCVVGVVGVVVAGLILCSCGSEGPPSECFTIAKAWWPAWDTFQIGVRRREKAESSFRTTFFQAEDYVTALEAFQRGEADAATLTIYEAILAASRGIRLKTVLLLDYTTGSDGIVAKNHIRSLPDLKGKRIGVQEGTIAHFTVLKALEKAGLDRTEVELVNLDLDALQQAFLHDQVDAAGIYEPYMSNLARQGGGHVVFSSLEIPRAICDVLFVKEALARDHPDVIDHWIRAWNDALNFKGSDTDTYLHALNLLNGTPVTDLKASFKGIFFTSLAENQRAFGKPDRSGYLLESLNEMQEFMLEQGIIEQRVPLEDSVDSGGIRRFLEQ